MARSILVSRLGVDGAVRPNSESFGDFESVVEAAGLDDGQYGTEDFFLLEFDFGGMSAIPWGG